MPEPSFVRFQLRQDSSTRRVAAPNPFATPSTLRVESGWRRDRTPQHRPFALVSPRSDDETQTSRELVKCVQTSGPYRRSLARIKHALGVGARIALSSNRSPYRNTSECSPVARQPEADTSGARSDGRCQTVVSDASTDGPGRPRVRSAPAALTSSTADRSQACAPVGLARRR